MVYFAAAVVVELVVSVAVVVSFVVVDSVVVKFVVSAVVAELAHTVLAENQFSSKKTLIDKIIVPISDRVHEQN